MGRFWALAGCVILFAMSAEPCQAVRAGDALLRIEVSMDARQYLVGQPILALVKVRNIGDATFRDLAWLNPAAERLVPVLMRGGVKLPWRGPRLVTAYAGEGMRLLPREAVCEVVEILTWFGEADSVSLLGGEKVWTEALPPGHYSLQMFLQGARTGRARSLDQVSVAGAPLAFDIEEGALDLPFDAYRRATMVHEVPGQVPLDAAEKIALLEHNADARALFLMWRRLDIDETVFSLERAIHLLEAHQRSPALVAAIVDQRCKGATLPDSARIEWIHSNKSISNDPDIAAVLDSWRLKLEQRQYYIRHRP